MLKRILLFLLLTSSVFANDWSTWFLADYNQMGVRFGRYLSDNWQVGGQSYWWEWEREDPPQTYGLYTTYELPEILDVNSVPVFNWAEGLINGIGYVGFQGAIELRDDADQRGYYGPMVGVKLEKFIFDTSDDEIFTGLEVQYVRYTDKLEEVIDADEVRVAYFFMIKF